MKRQPVIAASNRAHYSGQKTLTPYYPSRMQRITNGRRAVPFVDVVIARRPLTNEVLNDLALLRCCRNRVCVSTKRSTWLPWASPRGTAADETL